MLRAIGVDQRAALEGGEGVYAVAEAQINIAGLPGSTMRSSS
jgi:hypothetical protein